MNDCFVYYHSADRSVGTLELTDTENIYGTRLGIKSFLKLEKYKIDALGNYKKVEREVRKYFNGR